MEKQRKSDSLPNFQWKVRAERNGVIEQQTQREVSGAMVTLNLSINSYNSCFHDFQ